MEEYTGYIRKIRFYSEDSNFIVADFEANEELDLITFSGIMVDANMYDYYRIKGDYVEHPKYGFQFKLESYQVILSDTQQGVIAYLASPLFKGIGKKQAELIVETLGENCLNEIIEDESLLDRVKGMSKAKKETIIGGLKNSGLDSELMQFFYNHDLNLRFLAPIKAFYEGRTLEMLSQYPYQIMYDIEGIGFKTCDELALKIGFDYQDKERLKAATTYALKQYCYSSGSVYTSYENLKKIALRNVYGFNEDEFDEYLDELEDEKKIIVDQDRYYDFDLYMAEIQVAKFAKRLNTISNNDISKETIEDEIEKYESEHGIEYATKQLEAINLFINNSMSILTGGPGTGKTTVVKGMLQIYQQLFPSDKIALVAPTGRAAKRLTELTGIKATTIHSLLRWDLHTNKFGYNQSNPLEVEVLIIDEFSMVDTLLFGALARASANVFKILLIGDHHQLPSVMPGDVLNDLMQVDIPAVCLDEVFRQAANSGIVNLAHEIIIDEPIEKAKFQEYKDINFFGCRAQDIVRNVKTIIAKAIDEGYSDNDIQILAPMYQGVAGIDAINLAIRELFNPKTADKHELKVHKRIFREGDKVLQLKNRPEDEVYNGDIGYIYRINKKDNFNYLKDTIIVSFDDELVEYDSSTFIQLTHAYCMSVHKSQGSEFKIVIMPILFDYRIMLRKNLLYTGLSRAKQSLFLLGEYEAFLAGLARNQDLNRLTSLKERYNNTLVLEDFY